MKTTPNIKKERPEVIDIPYVNGALSFHDTIRVEMDLETILSSPSSNKGKIKDILHLLKDMHHEEDIGRIEELKIEIEDLEGSVEMQYGEIYDLRESRYLIEQAFADKEEELQEALIKISSLEDRIQELEDELDKWDDDEEEDEE